MKKGNIAELKALLNLYERSITFFDTDQIGFSEIQCLALALVDNTSLQELRFLDCVNIGNREIGLFSNPLMNNNTLKLLSFVNCGITDQGARILASILPYCKLETLALIDNRIGNVGFADLINALKDNKTLQNINLLGNAINSTVGNLRYILQSNSTLRTFFVDKLSLQEQITELTNRNKSLAAERSRGYRLFL